jgi:hypothetical protein
MPDRLRHEAHWKNWVSDLLCFPYLFVSLPRNGIFLCYSRMKYILPALIVLSMLASCASSKKYATFASEGYRMCDKKPVSKPANMLVKYEGPDHKGADVTVKKLRGSFVPAFFYWRVRDKQACTMKSELPVLTFERQFYATADSLNLASKLHGGSLNVHIRTFPLQFTYYRWTDLYYFLFMYFQKADQTVQLNHTDVQVAYEVTGGDSTLSGGKAKVPVEVAEYRNIHAGRRKVTHLFMKKYYTFSADLGRQCALQIYDQLK